MRCDDINELMSSQIDGRLDGEGQRLLSEHLAQCAGCRADFAALKDTVNMVRGIGLEQPPSDLLAKVRARIDEENARTSLPFEDSRDERSEHSRNVFLSPQSRMALAASLLLAVGVYGFMTRFERKEQGCGVSVSDDQTIAAKAPNAATVPVSIPSESKPEAVVAAAVEAGQPGGLTAGKAMKGVTAEEMSYRPSVREAVAVQKKEEQKEMGAKIARARDSAHAERRSDEIQNVHSRSIDLNRPAVINRQSQDISTSISREQGKAAFAESAASSQAGAMPAQSRQVQQVSNAWLNQQKMKADLRTGERDLSIVTDDVEGVLSVIRKLHAGTIDKKLQKDSQSDRQTPYTVSVESTGRTVVNFEMTLRDYQVLVEALKSKGEVTTGPVGGLQAGRLNADVDADPEVHVKIQINIILRK